MDFIKHDGIPEYIYASRVDVADIPFFEQAYLDQVEFWPEAYKDTPERFDFAKRIGYRFLNLLQQEVLEQRASLEISELGDPKFSWRFMPHLLTCTPNPQFVCAGAGVNISFELALAKKYPSSRVVLLDPSEQAVRYVRRQNLPRNMHFMELGLADIDGTVTFYKPATQGSGSLSALALHPGTQSFDLPVVKLSTVMRNPVFSGLAIDFLKFDVEGFEHKIIDNLILENIRPVQMAWEFDQPVPPWTIENTIRKLNEYGYALIDVWGLNVLAVDRSVVRNYRVDV